MKRTFVLLAALLAASSLFAQQELALDGRAFAPDSRNARADGSAALLAGMFSHGAAVYEFDAPAGTGRFAAAVQFRNLKGKWLKLYVYNYGAAPADGVTGNRNLDPRWRLWQATDMAGGVWTSANPEWVDAGAPGGRFDFLGPRSKIRLLLYADGGVPFFGDGRFLIEQVRILCDAPSAEAAANIVPLLVTSEDAWVEGGYLLVKGRGKQPVNPDRPGDENSRRAMAQRAATVVAQRNLAVALGRIPRSGGTAQLPGIRVRETKDLGNGEVEVTIEVPLDKIPSK
ncbi:hypothetical protein EG831_05130 [bacterium]|nr:hypothetical protein [bacterium]